MLEIITLSHPHQLKKELIKPTVMALGFFDGVHLGHQKVITTAKQIATERKLQLAVMTFSPHPKEVLRKQEQNYTYLTPLSKKIRIIEKLGVDVLYIINFTLQFANLTPQQFVDNYLVGLNVVHVVAGFDYSFGKFGEGTMNNIMNYAKERFTYTIISKVQIGNEKISSTHIRNLLTTGNIAEVHDLLGRYYSVSGIVEHGEKRGRQIGFPTANVKTADYLIPALGVYAVFVYIDGKKYKGVCNIGFKPTFNGKNEIKPTIEVNIFDFNEFIYDKQIKIQFIEYIRKEQKFNNINDLVTQIKKDREKSLNLLNKEICQVM